MFKATGLVADYAHQPGLIEPSATQLYDYSRWKNHGTFKADGEPDWVQLPSGLWVLDFNGANDFINCGKASSLNNLSEFTLLLWVRFEAGYGANNPRIYVKSGGVLDTYFVVYATTGKMLFSRTFDTTSAVSASTDTVSVEVWHLLGATLSSDKHMRLYQDGAEVSAYDTYIQGVGALTDDASYDLILGNNQAGTGTVDGRIGLVRLYNRALSVAGMLKHFIAEKWWFGV